MSSFLFKILPIAAVAAAGITATASATLTIDLRVADVDGVPALDPKSFFAGPGSVVRIDLYAIVTAATEEPGLEGFKNAIGSIVSNTGGTLGSILTNEFTGPFGAAGSTVGRRIDLDGDGDLDIGSNATALTNDFIGSRSASMTTGNANGLGTSEFRVYTITVGFEHGMTGPFSINWRKIDLTGLSTEYIWQENGILTNSRGVNGGSVAGIQVGAPVVGIPEPSAIGMILLGALGLVEFRLRGK